MSINSTNSDISQNDCVWVDTAKATPSFAIAGPSSQTDEYSRLALIIELTKQGLLSKGFTETSPFDVTLKLGFGADEDVIIQYSPNPPETQKLACLTKRSIDEAIGQTTAYEPANEAENTLLISFGTLESFSRYQEQRQEIASAITRAIALHYSP